MGFARNSVNVLAGVGIALSSGAAMKDRFEIAEINDGHQVEWIGPTMGRAVMTTGNSVIQIGEDLCDSVHGVLPICDGERSKQRLTGNKWESVLLGSLLLFGVKVAGQNLGAIGRGLGDSGKKFNDSLLPSDESR